MKTIKVALVNALISGAHKRELTPEWAVITAVDCMYKGLLHEVDVVQVIESMPNDCSDD